MAQDKLKHIESIILSRHTQSPDASYVARLLHKGENTILKKIGEEATELVMAGKSGKRSEIIYESADLLFHMMVMLSSYDIGMDEIADELMRREGVSGLVEKASRVE